MNASRCSSRTSKPRNASQFSYDGSQSSTKRVVATLANLVELLDLALERRLGAVLAELTHEGVHDRLVVLALALLLVLLALGARHSYFWMAHGEERWLPEVTSLRGVNFEVDELLTLGAAAGRGCAVFLP